MLASCPVETSYILIKLDLDVFFLCKSSIVETHLSECFLRPWNLAWEAQIGLQRQWDTRDLAGKKVLQGFCRCFYCLDFACLLTRDGCSQKGCPRGEGLWAGVGDGIFFLSSSFCWSKSYIHRLTLKPPGVSAMPYIWPRGVHSCEKTGLYAVESQVCLNWVVYQAFCLGNICKVLLEFNQNGLKVFCRRQV